MKTHDGYRFCLQFSHANEDYARVGECLERMGRKKSDFIVYAVLEYLARHPEAEKGSLHITVQRSRIDRAELEQIVRRILAEQMERPLAVQSANVRATAVEQAPPAAAPVPTPDDLLANEALESMLDNLTEFL